MSPDKITPSSKTKKDKINHNHVKWKRERELGFNSTGNVGMPTLNTFAVQYKLTGLSIAHHTVVADRSANIFDSKTAHPSRTRDPVLCC